MTKIINFISHIYHALRYGSWCIGVEQYEGKPQCSITLMPYDGWNFAIHLLSFYVCVSYPWCGDIS